MKNPRFSNDIRVEDQRSPRFQEQMDFLMRYLRAVDHRKSQDDEEWEPHQDDAYNTLFPPHEYEKPDPNFKLAPDFGKFRNYSWDDYLLGRAKR